MIISNGIFTHVKVTLDISLGGASGIGKGYATELAKEGFNIFIIDKSESDTANAKREIERLGVKCASLIYDFGMLGDSQEAEKLRLELENNSA